MEPMEISTFKSLDELLDSDYKMFVGDYYPDINMGNVKYQKAVNRGKIITALEQKSSEIEDSVLLPCSNIIISLQFLYHMDIYYILPERFKVSYLALQTGSMNPFQRKLQRLMDLSVDAGLPKAWRIFYDINVRRAIHDNPKVKKFAPIESKSVLDFSQILPICVILLIGHGIALLTFLHEIFHHDFLSYFGYFKRRTKKRVSRWRVVRGRVKAKKIGF